MMWSAARKAMWAGWIDDCQLAIADEWAEGQTERACGKADEWLTPMSM
jgi:hypothetical protein